MGRLSSPRPIRRLRFALIVLTSQLLLIALALAWAVHMIIVAANGRVYFVEDNTAILWLEIAVTVLISFFGITVFIMQLHRLSERRRNGETRRDRRG